jgi:acetyltransferase-like isoleucine patch superfamily enzyme
MPGELWYRYLYYGFQGYVSLEPYKANFSKMITTVEHADIFKRLRSGGPVSLNDPEYYRVNEVINSTIKLSQQLNAATDIDGIRNILGEITDMEIDESTTIFVPFYTNFGKFIHIGKNVFINHCCSFLDMGGITLEDNVLIGPKVNLITENHPQDPADRRTLITKPIIIKRNAWVGAGATILPGVTIGENAIVAAGAVVSKDVPANTVVGGIPARFMRRIS